MIRYVRLLALLSLVGLLACSKHYFHADSAAYEGITVQPTLAVASGDKLWLRTLVTNAGTQPIVVNRDAIVARLPNGVVVGRAMGSTTVHEPYFIPGGMSHEVNVEFHEAGFDWHVAPQATIDFTAGITRNGQPIPIQIGLVP